MSSTKNESADARERMLGSVPGAEALGRGRLQMAISRVTSTTIRPQAGARREASGTCWRSGARRLRESARCS